MTPKQQQIMSILENYTDANGVAVVSIHELGYPVTPDSINPAIAEFQALKDLSQLTDFERISSRVFRITRTI